jgi:hypothetical protein
MKKLMLSLGAIALSTAPVAVPTPAVADPGKGPAADVQAFCADYVQYDPSYTFGECVGILRSDDSAGAAKFCLQLKKLGLLEDWTGTTNQGQCIKYLNSL